MSKVIKGGMVCTADRTWKADVLIEGEKIVRIGEDLVGDEYIDAEGAYVIPGGIDPHTHLEMPFMGTTAAETFETGTWAAGFLPARRRWQHQERNQRMAPQERAANLFGHRLSHGDHRLERDRL